MKAVVTIELHDIATEVQAWAAMLADPRIRRIVQINEVIVDLGALSLPAAEQAALRSYLERMDDVGIALIRKALRQRRQGQQGQVAAP